MAGGVVAVSEELFLSLLHKGILLENAATAYFVVACCEFVFLFPPSPSLTCCTKHLPLFVVPKKRGKQTRKKLFEKDKSQT